MQILDNITVYIYRISGKSTANIFLAKYRLFFKIFSIILNINLVYNNTILSESTINIFLVKYFIFIKIFL